MPVGSPRYVENIDIKHFFGFVNVEVFCPVKNLCLPVKVNGVLMCPRGRWFGLYFSEEIKFCQDLGYVFKFYDGYAIQKG